MARSCNDRRSPSDLRTDSLAEASMLPAAEPADRPADAYADLLQRARQLLGEDQGGAGGIPADLTRCLHRLHRAQNRLDPGQLRQLGSACLQALEAGELAPDAQLQEAASALAGSLQLSAAARVSESVSSSGLKISPQPADQTLTEEAASVIPAQSLPTLSVVIPVGAAAADAVRATVASLLAGAPPGIEIIIVTTADSTDCGQLAAAGDRVRLIRHLGDDAGTVRDTGLTAATGEYVGFAEPGDEVSEGWAVQLQEAAERQHPALVKGEVQLLRPGRPPLLTRTCELMQRHTPLH